MQPLTTSVLIAALAVFLVAPAPAGAEEGAEVCVVNASAQRHFFAAEVTGWARETAWLAPGERLCARGGAPGDHAVVSVYEAEVGFEGCSRLVPVGAVEEMRRWSAFDRCLWEDHNR